MNYFKNIAQLNYVKIKFKYIRKLTKMMYVTY